MERPIGQTKDVGFQFGLRKTFPIPFEQVWDFLFSEDGLKIWLGELQSIFEINKPYHTKDSVEGKVRVFRPYSHIRLNWKKKHWENLSTLQVRVMGNPKKATISFHQEKLLNSEQRTEMKEYWNKVMLKLSDELAGKEQ